MLIESSIAAHGGRYAATIVNLLSHFPIVAAVILNTLEFDTSEQHFIAQGKRLILIRSRNATSFLVRYNINKRDKVPVLKIS